MEGNPLGHHLVVRLLDDRVIAPDAASRRALARTVARAGRPYGLLAFGCADTHLHVLMLGDRETATKLARALLLALRAALRPPVGFEATRIVPVRDQRHLANAFAYVQTNAARHGISDPVASEASSLHDLLGLRVGAGWMRDRVRAHLPRVDRDALMALLGPDWRATDARPTFDDALVDAAAAVFGVAALAGNRPEVVAGRRAVVHLARDQAQVSHVAALLGISPRAVRRLQAAPEDPTLVEALRRQLAWRAATLPAGRRAAGFAEGPRADG